MPIKSPKAAHHWLSFARRLYLNEKEKKIRSSDKLPHILHSKVIGLESELPALATQ